jgi:serine/threonine-protein kinase
MLESESGLTGSGAVLGTPSYMAPEQAAGRVREVGPAADIYALGAILYELLTGRPPFEGETAVETLVQVLDREPTPPRHLDPKIPVVLERLCLRCLDKDAARRPGRAADLAEALERYVSGEEVLLPAGGPVRAIRRWARREPALASRTLAFAVGTLALVGKYVLTDAFVDPRHHLVRSLVTQAALMAWIGVSWVFQRLLDRPGWADRVPTLWTLADVVAATVCLCALDGLFSPLTIAFPLLVGTSGLWFRVGQVWFTTVCSLVGFAALVCWTGGPAFEAPNLFRHAFYAGGLGVQGLATALLVQRVHVMARYAGRRAE